MNPTAHWKEKIKDLGPGLLFASSAIGTSHLILATRAGAHHGLVFLWIILLALALKYPFYEFAPRYSAITGKSILWAYRDTGKWTVILFLFIISVNMFTVTAAIAGVCAGLLSSILDFGISMNLMVFAVLLITSMGLIFGGFSALNTFIKWVTLLLFLSVMFIFFALIVKGPAVDYSNLPTEKIFEGSALAVLVSLLGWMPAGMEASVMHSIWVVKKKESGQNVEKASVLFDFRFGYFMTTILAVVFLVIGSYSIYGTGQKIEGSSVAFSQALLGVFVSTLGPWSFWAFGLAAFLTIYGTLIVVIDAFARSILESITVLKYSKQSDSQSSSEKIVKIWIAIISIGSYILFFTFASSMIFLLEFATTLAFLCAPFIAFLNLKAIQNADAFTDYAYKRKIFLLAYVGLLALSAFAVYYLYSIISN